MNDLQKKYGDKGLTILGVTSEGKKETESWIDSKGVEFAYAYDKGGKLKSKLGVGGIPHSFLIDPQGKIVWDGHPGSLDDKAIEKAIVGALPRPLYDLPASAGAVRTALGKRNYATALAEAGKLPGDEGTSLSKAIQGMIDGRVASMKSALEAGNFLTASEAAASLKKDLAGLPEAPEADKVAAAIAENKDAKKVIDAQKKVRAIADQKLGKRREFEKAVADLTKISKDLGGTFAEKEADETLAAIKKKKASEKE